MQKTLSVKVLPSQADDSIQLKSVLANAAAVKISQVTGFQILKRSIDARAKIQWVHLKAIIFIEEPFTEQELFTLHLKDVHNSDKRAVIIGAGPAGLFAAIKLIEYDVQPIILERGKNVRARRRDLAAINKLGIINPESNYCFGEGGAGTYSDGKLYTRSTKRGNVQRILQILSFFGADKNILIDAHPHIGTNKLPQIITAIRDKIIECGGQVLFEKKVTDFVIKNNYIKTVVTSDNDKIDAEQVILATGHSARDIFYLLKAKNIYLEAKPFALGVRVEHPQPLIDTIQYRSAIRNEFLPPASYSLVQQVNGTGVFSFCMCPGGIIAPAATDNNEIVVNGWSPSKRNNPFANSGIVVSINENIFNEFEKHGPLSALYYQKSVEEKAFVAGGGALVAPAQRLVDFTRNFQSANLPSCSYLPGVHSVQLSKVLPPYVQNLLQKAFIEFGKKMKGYLTNDALVVATESRTSSPVRIPRTQKLIHPQIKNLYPCGEGAGYAGGIVSAALDGERVAEAIINHYYQNTLPNFKSSS